MGEGSYSIPDVDLNYGLGDRIQLKFKLPIVTHEVRQLPGDDELKEFGTQARLDLAPGNRYSEQMALLPTLLKSWIREMIIGKEFTSRTEA